MRNLYRIAISMSRWKTVLTDSGAALLAGAAGKSLTITKAECGSGNVALDDLSKLTALTNVKKRFTITEITSSGNVQKVRLALRNNDIATSFELRQIGVYGKLGTGAETLYMVLQNDEPDVVPSFSQSPNFVYDCLVNLIIGSATGVEGVVDTAAFVTVGSLNSVVETLNAGIAGRAALNHTHTPSQVGLGNVSNLAIENQVPSYTEASTLSALTSGEKLSIAFGKIGKAIKDLIAHIANKSNPHSVTTTQIGAAVSGHTHNYAASDSAGGAANSAVKLTTARTLDGMSFDGSGDISRYAVCYTAEDVNIKEITLNNYVEKTGSILHVRFKNANTANQPALCINGGTSKSIIFYGGEDGNTLYAAPPGFIVVGGVYSFVFTGSYYVIAGYDSYRAQKLLNARTVQTKLNSTATASFDGTANITPGVTGTLGIGNGGTNATTISGARKNLEVPRSTTAVIDTTKTSSEVQAYIESLPRCLEHDVTVTVNTAGSENDNIFISGFYGSGSLTLKSSYSGGTTLKSITVQKSSLDTILIQNFNVRTRQNDDGIVITHCLCVEIDDCTVQRTSNLGTKSGIYVFKCGLTELNSCTVSGFANGICSFHSNVYIVDLLGNNTDAQRNTEYGIMVRFGSNVHLGTSAPSNLVKTGGSLLVKDFGSIIINPNGTLA